jgi:hypothetical protein
MPRLLIVVFGTLFVFWLAMAIAVSATVALASRPGEREEQHAAAPTPTAPVGPERPDGVPASATLVAGDLVLPGTAPNEPPRIFYSLSCNGNLLTVSTTREIVYARLPCNRYWLPDEVVRPFLAQLVTIRVTDSEPSALSFTAPGAGVARFEAAAVWITDF